MSCVSYRSHKRSWRELRTEFNFTSVLHELCDLEGFLTLRPSSFLGEILKCPAQPLPHFSNLFLGIYSIPGTSWRLGEMGSVRQTTKISDFIKKKKKVQAWVKLPEFQASPNSPQLCNSGKFVFCRVGAARLAPGAEWGEGLLVRLCSNQFGLERKIDEVLAAQCSFTILSGHLGNVQLRASSLCIGASQALWGWLLSLEHS